MDAFEENLNIFMSSTHGREMQNGLGGCFDLLRVEIDYYRSKINEIREEVDKLERR